MKNFRILMVLIAGFVAFGTMVPTAAYAGCAKGKVCEKTTCDKKCEKKECCKKKCDKMKVCEKTGKKVCDKSAKKCDKMKICEKTGKKVCSKSAKKCTKGMATHPHNDPSRYND